MVRKKGEKKEVKDWKKGIMKREGEGEREKERKKEKEDKIMKI